MTLPSEHDGFLAYGPCWACKQSFPFHPDLVPSVPIDPDTNLPPDLGHTDPRDAVRQPLCEQCIDLVNESRVAKGLALYIVKHGAYG